MGKESKRRNEARRKAAVGAAAEIVRAKIAELRELEIGSRNGILSHARAYVALRQQLRDAGIVVS